MEITNSGKQRVQVDLSIDTIEKVEAFAGSLAFELTIETADAVVVLALPADTADSVNAEVADAIWRKVQRQRLPSK